MSLRTIHTYRFFGSAMVDYYSTGKAVPSHAKVAIIMLIGLMSAISAAIVWKASTLGDGEVFTVLIERCKSRKWRCSNYPNRPFRHILRGNQIQNQRNGLTQTLFADDQSGGIDKHGLRHNLSKRKE